MNTKHLATAALLGLASTVALATTHVGSNAAQPATEADRFMVGASIHDESGVLNGLAPNGLQLNGTSFNGLHLNGLQLNGLQLNGLQLNGLQLNGLQLNGLDMNGLDVEGSGLAGPSSKRMANVDARAEHDPAASLALRLLASIGLAR